MSNDIDILGGMITPPPAGGGLPAYFDTGIITAIVDAAHVKVDLGDKQVTCYVPQIGIISPAVNAAVQVCVQENTYTLAAILSGGTPNTIPASQLPAANSTTQGAMSAAHWSALANASVSNTASRLVMRDAAGRAQFSDPFVAQDAATKNYTDGKFTDTGWVTVSYATGVSGSTNFGATGLQARRRNDQVTLNGRVTAAAGVNQGDLVATLSGVPLPDKRTIGVNCVVNTDGTIVAGVAYAVGDTNLSATWPTT